tara:strand:- start:1071 stop:3164 length:2094 start_codon:yes stop_codon:yes gene_type:complete
MANLRTNNLCGEGGRNAYNGSVFFDGTENRLDIAHSTDFDIADANTFECWIYYSSLPTNNLFLGIESSYWIGYNHTGIGGASNKFVFSIYNGSAWQAVSSSTTPAVNAWHHVAATKDGTSLKIYINGVLENTTTMSGTAANNSDLFNIGRWNDASAGDGVRGYISNLRVCKGHAVYTANFTPPTSPLTVHYNSDGDETVLLCCQDSDNPLQEATGKTLIAYGGLVEADDTELITNSGFTSDISGWTASGVQWSHSSGALMHFGNGNTQRNIFQDVTTVIGRRYVFRVEASSAEANTAYWQVIGSADLAGNNYIADNNNAAPLEYRFYFTADSTTTKIRFYSYDSSNSSNVRSYWYKASLKLAPQGEVPKVLPPFGTDAGNTFDGAIAMNSSAYMCFPTGRTEERGRGRVVIFGDNANNTYIEMSSGGIAQLFGLSNFLIAGQHASCSSTTRAVRMNGYSPSTAPIACNVMEFVTIATQSNATDFGDSTRACRYNTGFGSPTRGINANGNTPGDVNAIDYITIASAGDATDFGDLNTFTGTLAGSTSNSIRGLISGYSPGNNHTEYVTIATTGNGQEFGEATVAMQGRKGAASSTRALFASGYSQPTFNVVNTIDYFTISTLGNAVDFGDLTVATGGAGGTSDSVRAVFMGGFLNPGSTNVIDVVTIATTGNAIRFGDMFATQSTADAATSDSHGGLS